MPFLQSRDYKPATRTASCFSLTIGNTITPLCLQAGVTPPGLGDSSRPGVPRSCPASSISSLKRWRLLQEASSLLLAPQCSIIRILLQPHSEGSEASSMTWEGFVTMGRTNERPLAIAQEAHDHQKLKGFGERISRDPLQGHSPANTCI